MYAAGRHSRSQHCHTNEAHAPVNSQRQLPTAPRSRRKLRRMYTVPHAVDPEFLEHVAGAQAALTTAGLMLASAAMGVIGGSRRASASSQDAADLHSLPGSIHEAHHMLGPGSIATAELSGSSPDIPSSRQTANVQTASREAAPAAEKAEGRSALASSQSGSRANSSSINSAEQLWEGAWKAFEEPEQKQGPSDPETPSTALARELQSENQDQSSFPSLAARFFRQRTRSGARDRRRQVFKQELAQERTNQPDQADVWAKPQLALQGIAPAARVRLLACALAALEKQILALPDALDTASPEQWRLATQAITAACAMTSARAWIGYIPQGLTEDAQEALQQLAAHDTVSGHSQKPVGAKACSSFGQLLTEALPSDVQPLLKSPSQPAKSNKRPAADEPQELTPLASLQIEKACIHGALVSYLRYGWQASSAGHPSMMQTRDESPASSSTTAPTPSSVSSNQREARVSGEDAMQDFAPRAQQQQQMSVSSESRMASPDVPTGREKPSSRNTKSQVSRRAEAMAALEGRQPGMPPGGSGEGQAGAAQQMPMVLRCGVGVLQDMVVAVADAAADAYLAEAGVSRAGGSQGGSDPGLAADTWLLVLHPRLTTTRSLERFRNQVAMQRWMEANFGSVAAMYEDRHQLWGFNHKGRLLQRSLPARRSQELGSLTGMRYYCSTALEASDFLAPLLERLFSRIGDAVSWLLVRLIGRSLGLIYRGVRESLVPRQRPPVAKRGNQPRWAPL